MVPGPDVMDVAGAGTRVHVLVTGVGSMLPARSMARILRVCSPGRRPDVWYGVSQFDWGSPFESMGHGSLSMEHWKVSSKVGVALSMPKNSKIESGRPTRDPFAGPERIPVPG